MEKKNFISADEAIRKSQEAMERLGPVLDYIDTGINDAAERGDKELVLRASSPVPIEKRIFTEPGLREDVISLLRRLEFKVEYKIEMDPGDSLVTISWGL